MKGVNFPALKGNNSQQKILILKSRQKCTIGILGNKYKYIFLHLIQSTQEIQLPYNHDGPQGGGVGQ
jgi:hypothetical protein